MRKIILLPILAILSAHCLYAQTPVIGLPGGNQTASLPVPQTPLIPLATSTTTEVCWDGDSFTSGGNNTPPSLPASYFFAQTPVGAALTNNGVNQNNYAVAGQNLATIFARYNTSCHLNRPGTGSITKGYFIFFSTGNDIPTLTTAQLFAGAMKEWAAAKADGYTVIAETSPLDSGGGVTATWDKTRQLFNTLLYQAKVAYVVNATNFSITSNVATVTAANAFVAGQVVNLGTIVPWTTATYFNNQPATIISTGLSTTQFEFNFTHADVVSTPDTGSASMKPFDYLLDLDAIAPDPTYALSGTPSKWQGNDNRHPSSLFDSVWSSHLSTMLLLGDDPGAAQVYGTHFGLYTGFGLAFSFTPGHAAQMGPDTAAPTGLNVNKLYLDQAVSTGHTFITAGAGVPSAGSCTTGTGGGTSGGPAGSVYLRFDGTAVTTLYVCDSTTGVWTAK